MLGIRSADQLEPPTIGSQQVADIPQKEVRWHVAQVLPCLEMHAREAGPCGLDPIRLSRRQKQDRQDRRMQVLADLAVEDPRFRKRVVLLIESLTRTGSPAMRSRGRKLLAKLGRLG
jgi:hypothetical protein